jgi:iron complex outermembrane receptor protein
MRSFKGENLSVTIDGARLHGACPGKMDPPAFHIDFAEIERVEVGKGPFDVTTSGALGGTVNIVTRQPATGWHGGLQLGLGSFDLIAPSVSGSYGGESWSISGGYSYRRQDPYEDGDGRLFTQMTNYLPADWEARAYDVSTGWAGLTLTPAPGHRLEFQATAQRVDTALYPYLQMDAAWDDADRYRVAYTGQSPFAGADLVQVSASWVGIDHWMTDARRTTAEGKPRGYSMATLATASVGELQASLVLGRLTIGAEAYRRSWDAETTLWVPPLRAYRNQDSLPDADTDSTGIFATWEQPLGEVFELDVGARLDRAETSASAQEADTDLYYAFHGTRQTSRTDTLPGASATLTWQPDRRWTVFAGLGHSTRVPSAEERYYALQRATSSWVGNPALDPPRNTEADLGASFAAAGVSAEISVFRSWIADFVTVNQQLRLHPAPGVATPVAKSYANVDAGIWGGELALSIAATSRLTVSLGGSFTRGRQDPDPARNIDSEFLPEMLPPMGRLAVRYDAGSWFVEGIGIFSGAQDDVDADLGEVPTPGWGILDVRGGVNLGPFSLVLGIDNVFDRLYRESLSYARDPFRSGALVWEPGRSATVSAALRY